MTLHTLVKSSFHIDVKTVLLAVVAAAAFIAAAFVSVAPATQVYNGHLVQQHAQLR